MMKTRTRTLSSMSIASLLSVLLTLLSLQSAAGEGETGVICKEADLLILGGSIVTMNGDGEIIKDGGIAVVGSKLDAVGTKSEIE